MATITNNEVLNYVIDYVNTHPRPHLIPDINSVSRLTPDFYEGFKIAYNVLLNNLQFQGLPYVDKIHKIIKTLASYASHPQHRVELIAPLHAHQIKPKPKPKPKQYWKTLQQRLEDSVFGKKDEEKHAKHSAHATSDIEALLPTMADPPPPDEVETEYLGSGGRKHSKQSKMTKLQWWDFTS